MELSLNQNRRIINSNIFCIIQVIFPFVKGESKIIKDFHLFVDEARFLELLGEI